MKYQIRKLVWESNSSSMHSLVVTKKNSNVRMTQKEIRDEFYLDAPWRKEKYDKEVLKIYPSGGNDYDRSPFQILSSFSDKLNYAIAEYCGNCYDPNSYLEGEETFYDIFVPLLISLTGCDEVEYEKEDTVSFMVYTDVDSDTLDKVEKVPFDKRVHRDDWKSGESYYESHDVDGRPVDEVWFSVPEYGSIDHQSSGLLTRFLANNDLSLEDYLVRKDIVVVIDGDEVCELGNLIGCGLIDKDSIVLIYPNRRLLIDKENNDEETN